MKRAFRLAVWFFVGVALVAVPMLALSAELPVIVPGVTYSPPVSGNIYISPSSISGSGPVTITYPSSTINSPIRVPLPPVAGVPAGNQLVQIPTTISPNAVRVGAAVVSLARISGPIGLGLNLLSIVCSETSICQSSTDPKALVKNSSPTVGSSSYEMSCGNSATGSEVFVQSGSAYLRYVRTPSVAHGCSGESTGMIYNYCANPVGSGCSYDALRLTQNLSLPPASSAPVVDGDFKQAVIKLTGAVSRMGDLVAGLQAQNQPVPVDKPVLQPTSVTSDPVSTVNRDSAGNIINTTTTTVTTNVAPVTNTSTSNTVNVTQVTNTTTTNNLGATTSSSTTTAKSPSPDDPDIQFDQVDDVNLEKQELPLSMPVASSWGEGSCPPDPSVSVLGHPVAVPVHVVCAYMSGVRGAVIALFALISAYIVIGVKFEG